MYLCTHYVHIICIYSILLIIFSHKTHTCVFVMCVTSKILMNPMVYCPLHLAFFLLKIKKCVNVNRGTQCVFAYVDVAHVC